MMRGLFSRLGALPLWVGLLVVVVIQVAPFYVALMTSLKPRTDLRGQLLPPLELYVDNFVTAAEGNILTAIGNSVVVAGFSTVLVCLLGALTAYPLSRRETGVNKLVLTGIVGLIMIPPLSILVPLYSMLNDLDGVNTRWAIILVLTAENLPRAVFLYAAFIRTVPISLEEAATIDGANVLQVFFRVVMPLLKPVTATVAILTGVHTWNEYALSVFILTDPEVQTIAPAVGSFFSNQGSSNLGTAAAASLMALAPVLIAYLFLQRHFMKGMLAGAEKG
jgi:raffinose/stachyose/melibiose transport system permease protein